jgi:outer membrane protein assembly factor BamA
VFVDHVLIVGNDRTKTATIERELRFKAGEPLGLEAISESQRGWPPRAVSSRGSLNWVR